MERTCKLAERLDLVHHIPEAAISDSYMKEPLQCSRVIGPGCQKSAPAKTRPAGPVPQPLQSQDCAVCLHNLKIAQSLNFDPNHCHWQLVVSDLQLVGWETIYRVWSWGVIMRSTKLSDVVYRSTDQQQGTFERRTTFTRLRNRSARDCTTIVEIGMQFLDSENAQYNLANSSKIYIICMHVYICILLCICVCVHVCMCNVHMCMCCACCVHVCMCDPKCSHQEPTTRRL